MSMQLGGHRASSLCRRNQSISSSLSLHHFSPVATFTLHTSCSCPCQSKVTNSVQFLVVAVCLINPSMMIRSHQHPEVQVRCLEYQIHCRLFERRRSNCKRSFKQLTLFATIRSLRQNHPWQHFRNCSSLISLPAALSRKYTTPVVVV